MRVLVFTTAYPNHVWPNQGVFVKERITRLAQRPDCVVKVVAPVPYFPSLKINWRWAYSQVVRREKIEGVEVFHPRYPMIPKVGMSLYALQMFAASLPAVRRLRESFDFDLISAHTVYPDGLAGVLLGRVTKRPVVVSARGSDLNLLPRFAIPRRLIQATLRRADHIVAVCEALKRVVGELDVELDKVSVVPNGVDPDKFFPLPMAEARHKLGTPGGRIVLSVGELIPRKGFELLIDAVACLTEEGLSDLHLFIVGEGTMRKELEALIRKRGVQEHVRLVGEIPHRDLYLWYNAADVFCLLSSREGYPNVVLESLACGTPVVGSAVWGIPEILTSDEVGILTERDPLSIQQALREALGRRWQSDRIRVFSKRFGWGERTDEMLRLFRSIVDSQRSSQSPSSGKVAVD